MDDGLPSGVAAGLRAGDPAAWRALYDAHAARVWRGVARLLGPRPADVADVVQETMLAAARSARTYDPGRGTLWQWLWGIARTQVSLHRRKEHRHGRWKREPARAGADPPDSPHDAEAVRAALHDLPADYESLLTAKYLDGDGVPAIAARENLTETAVRSKLARAREAFRRAYARLAVPA